MTDFALYHGGNLTDGFREVIPGKKGRVERGPGLYMTTSLARARSYAKGGGRRVWQITLRGPLRWLETADVPLADVLTFVRTTPRLPKRKELLADMQRLGAYRTDGLVAAAYLNNLMVNSDALSGASAPALAEFFRRYGIDASISNEHMDGEREHWVILFNPERVVSVVPVDQSRKGLVWNLPLVTDVPERFC